MQRCCKFQALAVAALTLGSFSACVVHHGDHHVHGYGHAPADYPPADPYDGYHWAYPGGLTLIYDSTLALYSVHGHRDHYFHDGHFYRWHEGRWDRARHWNRGWERCDVRHGPRPIREIHERRHAAANPHHDSRPRHDYGAFRQPRPAPEHGHTLVPRNRAPRRSEPTTEAHEPVRERAARRIAQPRRERTGQPREAHEQRVPRSREQRREREAAQDVRPRNEHTGTPPDGTRGEERRARSRDERRGPPGDPTRFRVAHP